MIQDPNVFPKSMVHPAFSKGVQGKPATMNRDTGQFNNDGITGTPCRFPPVQALNQQEEDFYRAKGYLVEGERPAAVVGYNEYPKMLVHPEHVDEIPSQIHGYREREDGPLMTKVIPGVPEKFPHVFVKNRDEESEWNLKGYQMPRLPDPKAVERSRANPNPDREAIEYPRWENGVLVQDPTVNTSGIQEYPKWIGDKLVSSVEEEIALLGNHHLTDSQVESMILERRFASEQDDDAEVERIEAILRDQGIEVKDKPHGTVWKRVPVEPATHEDEEKPDDGGAVNRDDLIEQAQKRGIKIDKRWSNEKIMEALKGAAA